MVCELNLNKMVKQSEEKKLTFFAHQSTKPHNLIKRLVAQMCNSLLPLPGSSLCIHILARGFHFISDSTLCLMLRDPRILTVFFLAFPFHQTVRNCTEVMDFQSQGFQKLRSRFLFEIYLVLCKTIISKFHN